MLRYIALVGVSAISISAPVMAQDAAATPPAAAEEVSSPDIIVSARRRDESVQDVPLVVNAVTSEQMQKLNMRDFNEVQNLVPGLQFFSNANGIAAGAQLRGIQYDPSAGVSPSVAFYQNDAPIEGSLVLQTMFDVGQVEVLRGPQGTLRGTATPSGSIVVTTRRPNLNEAGGYVSATANSIGTQNYNGAVGVPIIPGVLAVRVAGLYNSSEGNRVHTIERDGDYRDPLDTTRAGRISVLFQPTDFLRLSASAQKMRHSTRTFDQYASFSQFNPSADASPQLITPSDRLSIEETPRTVEQEFNSYNWRGELHGKGQVLIYQGQKYDLTVDAKTNSDTANYINGADFYSNTHTFSDAWTHEIRLQNETRLAGMFDYVLGYFHSLARPNSSVTSQTPVFLPAVFGGGIAIASTPISIPTTRVTEESFFGNLTVHFGEGTELAGGIRQIKLRNPGAPTVVAGHSIAGVPQNKDGTIYVASLKHRFSENLMAYASFGTSLRSGAFAIGDFSVTKSALQTSFENLQPETSKSFEVGLKSTLFGGRVHANLAAYHQTFNNYPYRSSAPIYYVNYAATVTGGTVSITPTVSSFNFVASVPVEVNGVEGELSANVTPNWNVGLNASYSLGKIKNGIVPCNDLNGDGTPDVLSGPPSLAALQAAVGSNNVAGCRLTQRSSSQSPFSLTVQSEYHRDLSASVDGYVRGLFNFTGATLGDPQYAYDSVGSYGLLNLFAGIRDPQGGWDVSFFAKNVLNVTKATAIGFPATTGYQTLSALGVATAGTYTSTYAQISTTAPREFGLSVRFAFGSR